MQKLCRIGFDSQLKRGSEVHDVAQPAFVAQLEFNVRLPRQHRLA